MTDLADRVEGLETNRWRDEAAARLRDLVPEILARWEIAVRGALPSVRELPRLPLYDDIPEILCEVAQALAIGRQEFCERSPATIAHAEQRVGLEEYSLDEVVQEYAILRRIAVETLHENVPLATEALALVHGSLDQSIQEAVTRYVMLQQQQLRESEERYRLLVEGVRDYAIFQLDPAGCVSSWNTGAQRIFGYPAEAVAGRHYSMFFTPEDDGLAGWELGEARESGRAEAEGWRVRSDGTQFWVHSIVTPLLSRDGRLRGYAKVTRDMTERKFLEEQLLRTADDLAEQDRRKNEFLAMLAHELRTPLSAIANATHILENIHLDERAARQLGTLSRQTRNLSRLVADLMDISRISVGKVELRREPVCINRVVTAAAETVGPFIDSRGQSLACAIPAEPLTVSGDSMRLEQVVTNLLNNAAKYTEPGGTIFLTLERAEQELRIRVRDTGIGIEAALLPSIFDLFQQIDPSETRSHGGLGIGLALVRRLVEAHHGSIHASSDGPGRGAEFVVSLPLAAPEGTRHES